METENRIVVFDGLCNLCGGGARWLEHHQAEPPFRLVPMQSDRGRALLTQHGYDPDDPLTFLVLDGSQRLTQSDAWIHLMAAAGGGWRPIPRNANHPGRVARLRLSSHRAEPISLVWASEHLLSAAAAHEHGFAAGAICKQ